MSAPGEGGEAPAPVDGEIAIITGANGGLGRALVEEFGDRFEGIIGVASSEGSREELAEFLAEKGIEGVAEVVDLSDPASIAGWYKGIVTEHGTPGLIVNNAGIAPDGLFVKQDAETAQEAFNINLISPMVFMQLGALKMRKVGGAIVNVSSVVGSEPNPGQTIYGATKAGMDNATVAVAAEMGGKLNVNSIAFGPLDTEMWQGVAEKHKEAVYALMDSGEPLPREDASAAVRHVSEAGIAGKIVHHSDGIHRAPEGHPHEINYEDLAQHSEPTE